MNFIILSLLSILAAIDGDAVKQALGIFWKGMLAIVIVIGIIFIIVLIINKVSVDRYKKSRQLKDCDSSNDSSQSD